MNTRLLVIDDEESICDILKYNLEKAGYEVDVAYSAEEALETDLSAYSLCIVDIMMDKLSGFDFVRRMKKNSLTAHIPLIFCSALTEEDEKVMGLNIGADDYISKPFSISEVEARVRAVLRRCIGAPMPVREEVESMYEPDIRFRTLRLDLNEKVGYLDDKELMLTRTEFEILRFFLTHRNRVYSRQEIMCNVWGGDVVVIERTIDTNITRLRKKLGRYGNNIITRQGFGYGFKETY